jgi:hypothetical protein
LGRRHQAPWRVGDREVEELGSLVLPAPTKRDLVAALVSVPDEALLGEVLVCVT